MIDMRKWQDIARERIHNRPATQGRLAGKIAIVTGAAQGFGKGIAEEMVREGCTVVIADMNLPGAEAVAAELGELASARASAGSADPFLYFVQAGAFRSQADADAQRAKLAMLGWEARVSEREQNGRPVFRVRVGPFATRDDAEQLKVNLEGSGVESALVRVQR